MVAARLKCSRPVVLSSLFSMGCCAKVSHMGSTSCVTHRDDESLLYPLHADWGNSHFAHTQNAMYDREYSSNDMCITLYAVFR